MTWKTRHDDKKFIKTTKSLSWRQQHIMSSYNLLGRQKYIMTPNTLMICAGSNRFFYNVMSTHISTYHLCRHIITSRKQHVDIIIYGHIILLPWMICWHVWRHNDMSILWHNIDEMKLCRHAKEQCRFANYMKMQCIYKWHINISYLIFPSHYDIIMISKNLQLGHVLYLNSKAILLWRWRYSG